MGAVKLELKEKVSLAEIVRVAGSFFRTLNLAHANDCRVRFRCDSGKPVAASRSCNNELALVYRNLLYDKTYRIRQRLSSRKTLELAENHHTMRSDIQLLCAFIEADFDVHKTILRLPRKLSTRISRIEVSFEALRNLDQFRRDDTWHSRRVRPKGGCTDLYAQLNGWFG